MNNIIANPQQFQNVEDCLKGTYGFLGTTYRNICDGTISYVPNGFWDFVGVGVLVILGISLILFVFKMVFDN